ncbi:MAG: protein kinase [Planctomycetota bacterium]
MSCDPELLWTLVEQDQEPGDEATSLARHVESCVRCQQELARMGGEETWWQETRRWLSTTELNLTKDADGIAENESEEPAAIVPVDLSFLDPPTHPEMLGRIGRYDVEGLLGRGGMGVVLRANDQDLRRSVAVKVLAPEWAASPQARQRFAREAQAAASITHENVIPIYNVEPDAPLPFFVMRYIPGMTLERWVQVEGPPDLATLLRVASQMAEGLAAAHRRGLIHRDIKPGNILIGHGIDRVWITDFGLARAADSVTLTRTGVIAGTPHYMSPEQARGESVQQSSDLFSLGGVLYFLATGNPPFDAENTLAVLHQLVSRDAPCLQQQRSDLPPAFVSLVTSLLERSASRRPASADDVIRQLEVAQSEFQAGKRARRRWMSPKSRRRTLATSVCALLLVCFAYTFWPSLLERTKNANTSADRRPSSIGNPFESSGPAFEATGYEIGVSDQIASITQNDASAFDEEVASITAEIDGLLDSTQTEALPVFVSDDASWNASVESIENSLDEMKPDEIPSFVPDDSAAIRWQTDLRKAYTKAQVERKPLLLHFYIEECNWCEKLEQGCFQDPAVRQEINRSFVPVRVDGARASNLTQKFDVAKFPTDVLLALEGNVISKAVSPQDPGRYIAMLRAVADE